MVPGATVAADGRARRRGWRTALATLAVGAAVIAVGGCAASEPTDEGGTSGTSTTVPGELTAGSAGLERLLRNVADTDNFRSGVYLSDLGLAASQLDLARPDDTATGDEWRGYARGLSSGDAAEPSVLAPTCSSWRGTDVDPGPWKAEIGFLPWSADAVVEAGQAAQRVCILVGDFDNEAISGVVRSEPRFSDVVEEAPYGGTTFFRWGEDHEVLGGRTTARSLGVGGRLQLGDGSLTWADGDGEVWATIDAQQGRRSLGDDERFASVARLLDDRGAHSLYLAEDRATGDPALLRCGLECTSEQFRQIEATYEFLDGVELWGIGWGSPDGEEVATVVAVAATPDQAEANTAILERAFRSGTSAVTQEPYSASVTVVGSETDGMASIVTLARTTGQAPGTWLVNAVARNDLPDGAPR